MALFFDLRVNDQKIGYFEAVRISGGTDPDDINLYQGSVWCDGLLVWAGKVEHRFGDGAWVLVGKCLDRMGAEGVGWPVK